MLLVISANILAAFFIMVVFDQSKGRLIFKIDRFITWAINIGVVFGVYLFFVNSYLLDNLSDNRLLNVFFSFLYFPFVYLVCEAIITKWGVEGFRNFWHMDMDPSAKARQNYFKKYKLYKEYNVMILSFWVHLFLLGTISLLV